MKPDPQALEAARQVSRAHARELLAKANVVGVGVGQREGGALMLVVMVERKLPRSRLAEADLVPSEIEGLPVEVREVGELKADTGEPAQSGSDAIGGRDETD